MKINKRNIKIKILKTFKSKTLRDMKRENRRLAQKLKNYK